MDIFERMKSGEKIDIRTDTEYQTTARAEMERSMNLSQKAALLPSPYQKEVRESLDELFDGRFPASSTILPPFRIDRAKCMTVSF